MGPMLPEQQEQLENNNNNSINKNNNQTPPQQPWNTSINQSTILKLANQQHENDYSSNSCISWGANPQNNNNYPYLADHHDFVKNSTTTSSTFEMFKTSDPAFLISSSPSPLGISGNDKSSTTTTQKEPEIQQLQQHLEEHLMATNVCESSEDVKNNYTRRRRRGRLRLNDETERNPIENINSDSSFKTTTTTAVTTETEIETKTIKLDNPSQISLQEFQRQKQQYPHQSMQQNEHAIQQKYPLNNNLLLWKKFKNLPLLLLLLVITSLSNIARYVNNMIKQPSKCRLTNSNSNSNNSNDNDKKTFKLQLKNQLQLRLKFKLKLNNSNNTNSKIVKNCVFFIGLCVATTILPLNLVNAASPFQNTQKHSQHHNGHNHNNNNNNNNNNHGAGINGASAADEAYEIDRDGLAGDGGYFQSLTQSPSFPVSSAASSSETEFIYPSSQSEERFDDDDGTFRLLIPFVINQTETDNTTKTPLFPTDLFTKEQLENGAVICHIIGVIYMFVALAIVCDEFFVPSLDVIIEKLGITDDVAGATFMAAGGSAPELFTSVIGVFVSFDDVGIGTIVGSAVFNILFVIGMCALFSKTVLSLTWWPLFRDCSFYSVSLLTLIYFFRDNLIYWWEAMVLFFIYLAYVGFMKWNQQVERCVKKVITKNKVTRVRSTDQLMPAGNAANSSETSMATQPGGSVTSRAASETRSGPAGSSSGATGNSSGGTAGSTQTGAKFRHGLLQLMIHTIDPLHDDDVPGKVDEKATQLHAIASLKVLLDATKPQRGGATTSAANHVKINLKETTLADRPNGNIDTTLDSGNEVEDEPEALSMAWPSTARKRLTYVLVAPLLFPLWLTLPDTRTPRGKRFFPVTFIGSIMWIAAYSYLMVWWANVAGETARIPPEVMGLTFLAAGTSIPDLITSVIVARKGFGDMAVSSSVGSNIFDVTVGLPIPWLLYGIIYDKPVQVNSVGMVCSITILFMMLIFVVLSIACFRWKMNKGLGFTMFLLYFVFVAVSLMFEYKIIVCPV